MCIKTCVSSFLKWYLNSKQTEWMPFFGYINGYIKCYINGASTWCADADVVILNETFSQHRLRE